MSAIQTDMQTHNSARQTDIPTQDTLTYRHTYTQTDRKTQRLTSARQTDSQECYKDRHTGVLDRQTDSK